MIFVFKSDFSKPSDTENLINCKLMFRIFGFINKFKRFVFVGSVSTNIHQEMLTYEKKKIARNYSKKHRQVMKTNANINRGMTLSSNKIMLLHCTKQLYCVRFTKRYQFDQCAHRLQCSVLSGSLRWSQNAFYYFKFYTPKSYTTTRQCARVKYKRCTLWHCAQSSMNRLVF